MNLYRRNAIIQAVRSYFCDNGFLEVETPHRIPANAPEEYIDPELSGSWYLHTSPELCMKRLLCRGYERIFQISRCWRSSERGSRHVQEFTMLEWYRAQGDYGDLMQDCEGLLRHIAKCCNNNDYIKYNSNIIDLSDTYTRISVRDAFKTYARQGMESALDCGNFDEIMVGVIEPSLPTKQPVFLIDYPARMAALARLKPDDTMVAERFELYVGGLELANGFSELNDAGEQRRRFEQANATRTADGRPPLPLPEPFLNELDSMPQAAGIALGIDRLVMLFTDARHIDEVIAFTPEEL